MNKKHFNGAYYFKEIFMAELKKELPFLTRYMALIFTLIGADWLLFTIGVDYNMWSDPFDLFKFIIKIITILALYFTGIKFFNWLYSASPQKIEK